MQDSWTDSSFWKLGAFVTDIETGRVYLGKGGRIERTQEFTNAAFYLKDFYTSEFIAYYPEFVVELPVAELLRTEAHPVYKPIENFEKTYEEDFKKLQDSFSDSFRKVVLVSRETYESSDPEVARRDLFQKALSFGTGSPYGFWFEDYGIIGSTPEILFTIRGEKLSTTALAGTAPRVEGDKLLTSSKDREEQHLVVKDIQEKMKDFQRSSTVSATYLQPFKSMVHLKTDLTFELKPGLKLTSLVNKLSPTAALGGYPMKEAMSFLKNTQYAETFPQRYFGSTLGFNSPDFKQFLVMIRNVQWKGQTFFIESGGGVLKESKLDNELKEIRLKRESVKSHYL